VDTTVGSTQAAAVSRFAGLEFTTHGTYYALAEIINDERPYGRDDEVALPDFGDSSLFAVKAVPAPEPRTELPETLERRRDTIDVFGELVTAKAPADRVDVHVDSANRVMVVQTDHIEPVDAQPFVQLPNGDRLGYTKGLRIPYKYKDDAGVTVYANIIVLFSGTGHI
jgi:hypothetical protein